MHESLYMCESAKLGLCLSGSTQTSGTAYDCMHMSVHMCHCAMGMYFFLYIICPGYTYNVCVPDSKWV